MSSSLPPVMLYGRRAARTHPHQGEATCGAPVVATATATTTTSATMLVAHPHFTTVKTGPCPKGRSQTCWQFTTISLSQKNPLLSIALGLPLLNIFSWTLIFLLFMLTLISNVPSFFSGVLFPHVQLYREGSLCVYALYAVFF